MERAAFRLTAADARRLAIEGQRLSGTRPRPDARGVLGAIRDIGYLQLDPTNVVARNPYLVLWSRLGTYDPAALDGLLARRRVFETPSLILPIDDLAIHAATMRAYRRATDPAGREGPYRKGDNAGGGTWAKYARSWLTKNRGLRREALARLRHDGPLPLTAFEDRAIVTWSSGGWNNERNVTMLLAILQRRGEIVVAARRRGQKLYALADGWFDGARPLGGERLAREAALRSLRILGVATPRQIVRQYSFGRHVTRESLASLERRGEIVRVEIAGDDGALPGTWYAPADVEQRLGTMRARWSPRTALLSPFDNLIIDRDRLLALFGYFYRMEIYVPPRLRKLGYWAMPVLMGDAIVGSVDPKLDRETRTLIVNKVVIVPGVPAGAKRAIRGAVQELAEFVGAERVDWGRAF